MSDERKPASIPIWWPYPAREPEHDSRFSDLVNVVRSMRAMPFPATVDQLGFAWGDPGTETGHTIGTTNADLTLAVDGLGNVDKFLRFELEQTTSNADSDLTRTLQVQRRVNGGTYGLVPTSGASEPVLIVDHASITHGGNTTDRVSLSIETFKSTNAGIMDTSATSASFSWTGGTREHREMLISLRFVDANLSPGDTVDFRMVRNGGGLLASYTVSFARMTWQSVPTLPRDTLLTPTALVVPTATPNMTVFS